MANQQDNRKVSIWMALIAWIVAFALAFYLYQIKLQNIKEASHEVEVVEHNEHVHKIVLKLNNYNQYVANGTINNLAVKFLLDTGASTVAIPESVANQLKLQRGQIVKVYTASGEIDGYITNLYRIQIGNIVIYNVKAMIIPDDQDEEDYILLGMTALKKLDFSSSKGKLTITQKL